jgi:branched-chain amino acid transport system substrate-binding protein
MVKAAKQHFKISTVTVIGPNDAGGTETSKQAEKYYGELGVKTTSEYYQRGTADFSPVVQRVLNGRPDALELSAVPPGDVLVLVRQLRERGYTGVYGSVAGQGRVPILQAAGGPQNLKSAFWGEAVPPDHPGVIKMKQDHERLLKSAPPDSPLFAPHVVAAEQLMLAITAAGTDQDGDKIAEALRKMTPESRYLGKGGWRGKAMYGVNQELAFPVGLGMVVDGKSLPWQVIQIPTE